MDFAPTTTVVPASAAAAVPPEKCNLCRQAPVTSYGYKTCSPCRDKQREQKKKYTERKREAKIAAKMALLKPGMKANIPAAPPAESSSSGKLKKRKAVDDGENAADVFERMRKRFKKMEAFAKTDVASKKISADQTDPVFEKFIAATHLHKDLKRRYLDNSTSLRFYGTYAIIAFPDIDNKKRARQVASDLRDNTSLHFDLDDRKSHRSSDTANTYTVSYKCTCHSASALKRSASDLSVWFASKNATPSEEKPKSECRGRIQISAEDDKSHRLGWLGQRVKVTVTHPKKA
ncbi:hypothetical protein C8R44DRAFT_884754 [Mycena epipterygia]|nr:hypothetical protein C8R44DRAFT_884754 [Mycena epipterygia]